MSKKWVDLDQVYFPVGVSSVYYEGRRVLKRDIQIDRNFREIMVTNYAVKDLPDHIDYLPRKKAAEYLNLSESTLIRYDLDGNPDIDIFPEVEEGYEEYVDEATFAADENKGKKLNKPFRT